MCLIKNWFLRCIAKSCTKVSKYLQKSASLLQGSALFMSLMLY